MQILYWVSIAILALLIGPSSAQIITGCSSVVANRVALPTDKRKLQADADCFGLATVNATASVKVPFEQVSASTIASTPAPPPQAAVEFVDCAAENQTCKGNGWGEVRYGTADQNRRLTLQGNVVCGNDMFGDPAPNVVKRCSRRAVAVPLRPVDIKPIASAFAAAPLIQPGAHNPVPSMAPDVVGAFRMICTAGQLNHDDPILYPSVKGGSPHLHQWYGNTLGNYASTYENLRGAGESTCSNMLNRSAYWVPALLNAAGKVIVPDYVSLYYKRHADGDPACLLESAKGCVGLPTGLRAVSGFDMRRMGEKQAENATFTFRCISPGKPSIHRRVIAEAIADCGGAGQIDAAINFGNCWSGTLDSADHRSHLTSGAYVGHSYAECPASHPYIIPQLTQGVVYTIAASDGDVWFSSDRMNGMNMPGGSTFHADYMEAWDPATRTTWERRCIGKLLNCSDGELGDGTMLRRGGLSYVAELRLTDAPTR